MADDHATTGDPEPGDAAAGRGGADPADPTAAAHTGVTHLQRAASEVIAAARSFLDAAEGLVADPDAVQAVSEVFGAVAKAATEAGVDFTKGVSIARGRSGTSGAQSPAEPSGPDVGDDGDSRVRRIRLD